MAPRRPDDASTIQAVEELFGLIASSEEEVLVRLKKVDRPLARRLAVERLARGNLNQGQLDTAETLLVALGLGEQREAVCQMALDGALTSDARNCALHAIVGSLDQEAIRSLVGRLPPGEAQALEASAMEAMVAEAESDPASAEGIATLLRLALAQGAGDAVLAAVESARKRLGARAVTVYRKSLGKPALGALRAELLAAILEESAPEAVALLQRSLEATQDEAARRELQAALMRLRTREIAPVPAQRAAPAGYAQVSSCDGQGAIIVLGCFTRSARNSTLANVCLRLSADVRSGFLSVRETEASIRQMVLDLAAAGLHFTRVGLEQAAVLVAEGRARTLAMGTSVPPDVEPAVARFATVPRPAPEPPVEATTEVGLEEVRALLARREHARSWFFDRGDLSSVGAWPMRGDARWLADAAHKLEIPALRARLGAMTRYMARWSLWNGDARAAAVFAALAAQVERGFGESLLVRCMLESSLQLADQLVGREEAHAPLVGSPESRKLVRLAFFSEVRKPRGRDLALLDLTEVAHEALLRAGIGLRGDQRPRDDELLASAHLVAGLFLQAFLSAEERRYSTLEVNVEAALAARCGIPAAAAKELAREALLRLNSFVADICRTCPVSCLTTPDKALAQEFFAPRHPSPLLR